jgi:hypothetical protein
MEARGWRTGDGGPGMEDRGWRPGDGGPGMEAEWRDCRQQWRARLPRSTRASQSVGAGSITRSQQHDPVLRWHLSGS